MKINFTDFRSEFKFFEKDLIKKFKLIGRQGDFILGKELVKFEKKISKFLKVKYVLGIGNWTEGMIMSCKALNFSKDDEIITVSNSFIATCGAIAYADCKPILVDVDETLNMDVNFIEKKITKKTKAIMPVHLSGIPSNIDQIKKIAKKYNLIFIEDAAHAFGGTYKGKYLGTLGDIGIFSLHPRKNFHVLGDGGLIVTNNKKLYQKLKLLRNHGLKNRNSSITWGTNSRLDNIQAGFANILLKKIDKLNDKFYDIANYYTKNLKNYVQTPIFEKKISKPTFHQYIIRTKKRDSLKKFLFKKGIQTAIHYPLPIHKQPAFINSYGKIKLKKTEVYSKEILSLPIHNFLTKKELIYIIKNIQQFFKKN